MESKGTVICPNYVQPKTYKMKKSIITGIILVYMLTAVQAQEQNLKPYGIKSGIIEYKYSGDKTGTGTLYFDDYGMKNAMFIETVADGEESKGWVVSSGDYQYMWDPDQPDDGMKMKNPLISWMNEASEGDMESFIEESYTKMGMVEGGKESWLGKECTVLKGEPGKVLIWNGILMVSDFRMGSYISRQEATSAKTNVPVDAKYFIIPQNITFTEMNIF
jgi:hypothetical protein